MFLLAKYNTQTTFVFPMIKRGVVDFAVSADWTPATGDTKISKDGGAVANTTNNPAAVTGTGSALWSLTLTAAELQAGQVEIQIVDSATKAVEDQCLIILTYGDASAAVPLPAALTSGKMESNVGTITAGAINAAAIADAAIDDAAVAADMDSYTAKIWIAKEGSTTDHYAVRWFKNNVPITSGITSPTIQVIKGSDGTDLIASVALTEIGTTHRFKRDESTNKLTAGAIYFAVVSATIDSATRTFEQPICRDSA